MPQLEHIEAIEKRLWTAADTLRANSNYASNEYFLPVMGLVFLRHAYSRFLSVAAEVEKGLPKRGGKVRPLAKEDFSQKGAIFLRPEARFDHLVALPDSENRVEAIIGAMKSIEEDYQSLQGVLSKGEYQELDNETLGQLLKTLNPDELKKVSGDVFGRIYEYFLTQFADQKAHDGGEFFTPISLVSLIANVIEPAKGVVLDPACGSGGMFVQSARVVERRREKPSEKLTFRGLEKNATTIRLAKMNLAVHGLEGDIKKAITYYEDPHALVGQSDYVMANPPFNVDEIDSGKVAKDPRLPFGLPGVNKKEKVSNGNYVWISYFWSYLNAKGRAGFVMSSQASSAGRDEAIVRRKLVETGDVDVMVAVRSNFFYTRTVPCELWFLDRAKPKDMRDKVLMIDARNVYRKVTRKIYDFSPEQERNLLSIVWLYRGRADRYLGLLAEYCEKTVFAARACFAGGDDGKVDSIADFSKSLGAAYVLIESFAKKLPKAEDGSDAHAEYRSSFEAFVASKEAFKKMLPKGDAASKDKTPTNAVLKKSVQALEKFADQSRDLVKDIDLALKLLGRLAETCEAELKESDGRTWPSRELGRARKTADESRAVAVELLHDVRYYWKQARWLVERFPDGKLCDVPGLVKLVSRSEIESNDWSLSPGRYVGVAPEEEDEDFDFEETMRGIHKELSELDAEAFRLAAQVAKNFEGLGV